MKLLNPLIKEMVVSLFYKQILLLDISKIQNIMLRCALYPINQVVYLQIAKTAKTRKFSSKNDINVKISETASYNQFNREIYL